MCRFAGLVMAVLLFNAWACCHGNAEEKPPLISNLIQKDVKLTGWRYRAEDVAGAEKPDFDDSAWKTGSPSVYWGKERVCWFRKTIILDDNAFGFPCKGATVGIKIGMGSGNGELYVNGELIGKFQGELTTNLVVKAAGGEHLDLAIKGIQSNGMLERAFLQCDPQLSRQASVYRRAESFMTRLNAPESAKRAQGLYGEVASKIDMNALKNGDRPAFLKSADEAQAAFKPLDDMAKEYKWHLVGHAHIDMMWRWLWPETIVVLRQTFDQALKFMDEFPGFTFSQSQAAAYKAMEDHHPAIFRRMQDAVKKGQWDVIAGQWVESDMNMPSGEALVRQNLTANRYMKEKFGVTSRVLWAPDTFGFPNTLPQIIKKSDMDYCYHTRCPPPGGICWWIGPDGSRVLDYGKGGYTGPTGYLGVPIEEDSKGVKDDMRVYGVGDHGGGPTHKDIKEALEKKALMISPKIEFSTAQAYFDSVSSVKESKIPEFRGELNSTFEGCYTSHSSEKRRNRLAENFLPAAESLSFIATQLGGPAYPGKELTDAWRSTCFRQFHDILCGSSINSVYDYTRTLFKEEKDIADRAILAATKHIASRIDTRGKGAPVVVFNPLAWKRTSPVSVALDGKWETVRVAGAKGELLPAQVAEEPGGESNTVRTIVTFIANDVPGLGYRTFFVNKEKTGSSVNGVTVSDKLILENEFLRVTVDPVSGTPSSIFDKKANRELVLPGAHCSALTMFREEADRGVGSAWNLGAITETNSLDAPVEVKVVEQGPARATIESVYKFSQSSFRLRTSLLAGIGEVVFYLESDWHEKGGEFLKVAFPLDVPKSDPRYSTPFGDIQRKANGKEVVGQMWVDLGDETNGVALLNDCKYGYSARRSDAGITLNLSVLRAIYYKGDQGVHPLTYCLMPRQGPCHESGVAHRATEVNSPLLAVVESSHKGTLPPDKSFVQIEAGTGVVTAFKKAEDSEHAILRLYQTSDKESPFKITFGLPVAAVDETNLMEYPTEKTNVSLQKDSISGVLLPREIKTIRIKFVSGL